MLDVKTRRNLSRHKNSCRDTRNMKKAEILSRQEIKEQYRKNTATYQFMLGHKEKYKAESLSQHKISCRDTDYCNLENPVETLYEEVMLRQSNECHNTRRQDFWP